MTTSNTTIQLKKSGVSGNVPSSLLVGELGLNYADGILYYKNTQGNIKSISGSGATNSFATIVASNGSSIFATSNNDILSLVAGSNITITTNPSSKQITISSTASGNGGGGTVINNGFPYVDLGYVADVPAAAMFDAGTL